MTNASPVQVRSFASTKSVVSCVLHFASRAGTRGLGALVAFGDAVGRAVWLSSATVGSGEDGVPAGPPAQAVARTASAAMLTAQG